MRPTTFLSILFKRLLRSPSFGKDITLQIILGFIAVVSIGYFLFLGFNLEKLIINTLKQDNVIDFLTGLLGYYFIGEFIIRYLVQKLPAIDIQPYLHLPIKRGKIVNVLLGLTTIHVLNTFVFLLFTPFALGTVAHEYGTQQAWTWLLSLWFVSLILHFTIILIKLNSNQTGWKSFVLIIVSCLVASADYFGWVKFSLLMDNFFESLLQGYIVIGVLLLVIIVFYYTTYRSILNRFYPEELRVPEHHGYQSTNFSLLQSLGLLGTWISLELKLIFRNKRTQEVFFMSTMFFFIELILCHVFKKHNYGSFLYFGILSSGLFLANYGQYLFSWQGDHFDFILTRPTSLRTYVESKYWLLASTTGLWFLFSIPFAYFGWEILFINLASTLYNVGVNLFIVMNMAMWGAKRINLKTGGTWNYEGMGASQWLMIIPFAASPFLFYFPFSLMGHKTLGVAAVGLAGLVGIALHKKLIDFTYKRLFDRRHNISSSFRKG